MNEYDSDKCVSQVCLTNVYVNKDLRAIIKELLIVGTQTCHKLSLIFASRERDQQLPILHTVPPATNPALQSWVYIIHCIVLIP